MSKTGFTGNVSFVLGREQDMNLGLHVCDTKVWFGFSENFSMGKQEIRARILINELRLLFLSYRIYDSLFINMVPSVLFY